jgi:signal transduction histidine kinase
LFVAGIIAVTIRIRVRSMEGRNRELQKLVRQRTVKIEEHNQEMEALYHAGERMNRFLKVEQVLQTLVDVAIDLLHAEKCAVLAWDAKQSRLTVKVARGFIPGSLALHVSSDAENPARKAAETRSTLVIGDCETEQESETKQSLLQEGIRSLMLVPILAGGDVFGVFAVFSSATGAFTSEAQRLFATLVQRASLSIENAQLFEQTRELAVVEERSRLARDLHDSAKQKAFAALAQLGTAGGVINNDPAAAKDHLYEAENLVYEVIEELTFLIQEMYPKALQEKGLANALREYVFEWENRADAQVDLHIENERRLDLEIEQALYRVIQEALSNVARHSKASQVTVKVAFVDGEVQVCVADNGVGFERESTPVGVGMRSMQERVAKIHGTLRIESTPGQGTQVVASAPGSRSKP